MSLEKYIISTDSMIYLFHRIKELFSPESGKKIMNVEFKHNKDKNLIAVISFDQKKDGNNS